MGSVGLLGDCDGCESRRLTRLRTELQAFRRECCLVFVQGGVGIRALGRAVGVGNVDRRQLEGGAGMKGSANLHGGVYEYNMKAPPHRLPPFSYTHLTLPPSYAV